MTAQPSLEVREEVLNVVLAELLSQRGLLSIPESIRRAVGDRTRKLPDVTVADLYGARIVIEGRIGTGSGVRDTLLQDASARVEQGISHICLAVLYPPALRTVRSLSDLQADLARATLSVRVVSEANAGVWVEATVDGLTDILRRSYDLLVSEDVVVGSVEALNEAIELASEIIARSPAIGERIRVLLGIPGASGEPETDEGD